MSGGTQAPTNGNLLKYQIDELKKKFEDYLNERREQINKQDEIIRDLIAGQIRNNVRWNVMIAIGGTSLTVIAGCLVFLIQNTIGN